MGQYYRRSNIKEGRFYGAPNYIHSNFEGIKAYEIVACDGDRLDIMAQSLFGNSEHWKALALFNDIGYFFAIPPGKILRIPYNIQEVLDRI